MKKPVIALLAVMMSLTMIGCSNGEPAPSEKPTEAVVETQTEATTAETSESETEATTAAPVLDSSAVNVSMINGKVVFEISPSLELTDSAWLGLIDPKTEVTSESEARSECVFWVARSKTGTGDPYVFEYSGEDIAMIPQEDFMMVLCDSDPNGKIILQFPVTVTGAEIKCDLSQIKFN